MLFKHKFACLYFASSVLATLISSGGIAHAQAFVIDPGRIPPKALPYAPKAEPVYTPKPKPKPRPKARASTTQAPVVANESLELTPAPPPAPPKAEPYLAANSSDEGLNYNSSAFSPRTSGPMVTHAKTDKKRVALTFDDGPAGTLTTRTLDILARYNAKGTFFVQGVNIAGSENILRRMVRDGHEVANHSWNHAYLSKVSRDRVEQQLVSCNRAIERACGVRPTVMRPPGGFTNMPLAKWTQEKFGLRTIMWSVDTNDWKKPGAAAIARRAIDGARNGSIILVHDIHPSTVDAVEAMVRGLQGRGFELVTVSELLADSNPPPQATPALEKTEHPDIPGAAPMTEHLKGILVEPPNVPAVAPPAQEESL